MSVSSRSSSFRIRPDGYATGAIRAIGEGEKVRTVRISLQGFRPEGNVLDVGAGGECVIARALRRRITGLELRREEIEEVAARGLGVDVDWVAGDARRLAFSDGSFAVVTFFFTLMYMTSADDRRRAVGEAARVLRRGGELYVWDFALPGRSGGFAGLVEVVLPGGEVVNAGYGFRGKHAAQTARGICRYLEHAGLHLVDQHTGEGWFSLVARKAMAWRAPW